MNERDDIIFQPEGFPLPIVDLGKVEGLLGKVEALKSNAFEPDLVFDEPRLSLIEEMGLLNPYAEEEVTPAFEGDAVMGPGGQVLGNVVGREAGVDFAIPGTDRTSERIVGIDVPGMNQIITINVPFDMEVTPGPNQPVYCGSRVLGRVVGWTERALVGTQPASRVMQVQISDPMAFRQTPDGRPDFSFEPTEAPAGITAVLPISLGGLPPHAGAPAFVGEVQVGHVESLRERPNGEIQAFVRITRSDMFRTEGGDDSPDATFDDISFIREGDISFIREGTAIANPDAVVRGRQSGNRARLAEQPPDGTISFVVGGREVLMLTREGFRYNGDLIEDAGEAHRVFTQVMDQMANPAITLDSPQRNG